MLTKCKAENFHQENSSDKAYEIRNSSIHGRGLFAARNIKKGERIVEYLGDRISAKEADKRGLKYESESETSGDGAVYIFEVNENLFIDGNFEYNDARLINHACRTNCETVEDNERIFIEATCDIKKGEELLYNYGYAFEHFLDHPCKCGFEECCGYIISVEDRPKLKKILNGRKPKWLKDRKIRKDFF